MTRNVLVRCTSIFRSLMEALEFGSEKIRITGFQKIRDQVRAMIKCEVSMTDKIGSKAQKAVRDHDLPGLDL